MELARSTLNTMWGFSVEAELVENSEKQDELCCYVSRVEDRSVAMENGIIKGDEIMVINGAIVSDLDMMYIESVLQVLTIQCWISASSAANRLIGEVVQSRRRPLLNMKLGPQRNHHKGRAAVRHYANQPARPF